MFSSDLPLLQRQPFTCNCQSSLDVNYVFLAFPVSIVSDFFAPPHVLYPVSSLTPVWPISLFRLLSPFSDLCIVSLISFAFPVSPVPLLYRSLSLRISTLRANIAYLTEEEPLTLSLSCWFLLLQPSLPCSENLNLCPGLNIFFSFPSSPYPDAKRINRELVVVVQSTPGSVVPLAMFRFSDLIFSCSQSGGIRTKETNASRIRQGDNFILLLRQLQ